MKSRSGRVVGACTLTALVAGAAVAAGAIPDSGGAIHACYATGNGLALGIPYSKGDVRAVDQGEACRPYEKAISWNQTGPAGKDGVDGADATGVLTANVAVSHDDVDTLALVNGDATAVREGPEGHFVVTFARKVRGCAATATTGPTGGSAGNDLSVGWATADTRNFAENEVAVDTVVPANAGIRAERSSFHLIVAC